MSSEALEELRFRNQSFWMIVVFSPMVLFAAELLILEGGSASMHELAIVKGAITKLKPEAQELLDALAGGPIPGTTIGPCFLVGGPIAATRLLPRLPTLCPVIVLPLCWSPGSGDGAPATTTGVATLALATCATR